MPFEELEKQLNYSFKNPGLLKEALVHSSLLNERSIPNVASNERLEYLGDAVVGLIIARELFLMIPNATEGELTQLRSSLVCRSTLATLARKIGLGKHFFIGKGEEATGGRDKPANLARGLEAVLGAIYLDGGLEKAKQVTLELYDDLIEKTALNQESGDYKSSLQELVQLKKLGEVTYHITDTSGPAHEPDFTVEVRLDDDTIATGKGKNKKAAETEAAFKALNFLRSKMVNGN